VDSINSDGMHNYHCVPEDTLRSFHVRTAERFSMAQEPLLGHDRLIIEDSQLQSDTPHSVGLLWTRDRSDAEKASMMSAGIKPTMPASKKTAADHALECTVKNGKTSSLKTATFVKCVRNCTSSLHDTRSFPCYIYSLNYALPSVAFISLYAFVTSSCTKWDPAPTLCDDIFTKSFILFPLSNDRSHNIV